MESTRELEMASIRELHQQLIRKERSAVEITTEAALERIQFPRTDKYTAFYVDRRRTSPRECQVKWMPK